METNVLLIINFPVALRSLPIAANGLLLVTIGNDIWGSQEHYILCGGVRVF